VGKQKLIVECNIVQGGA